MADAETGVADRVAVTAHRLRMVQVDFADRPVDQRRRYMHDELGRALAGVAAADRDAFLDELRGRFPAWEGDVTPADLAVDVSAPGPVVTVADPAGGVTLDDEALRPLRDALSIDPDARLNPHRAVELLAVLAAFAGSVHQLTWTTWRAIAPQSTVRRTGNFQKLLARFLTDDRATAAAHVHADVDRLRQLVASLISAIGQVGRQFAATQLARFAPAEIESAVAAEASGNGWWPGAGGGREARCWRKYVELAEVMDQAAIEAEIREVIVGHAEQLLRRAGAGPGER